MGDNFPALPSALGVGKIPPKENCERSWSLSPFLGDTKQLGEILQQSSLLVQKEMALAMQAGAVWFGLRTLHPASARDFLHDLHHHMP